MEQESLSVMVAFVAGVVSFFSPCHLPLLPVYLGFLAGSAADEKGTPQKNKVFFNSVNFVVGFSVVFILLGVAASWFAGLFAAYQDILQRVAGIFIVFFGLYLSGLFTPVFMMRQRSLHYRPKTAGPVSSMLMGMAFAAGWTPCIGPVLGAIIAYVAATGSGISLFAAFSLGMAVPFLAAALMVEHLGRWLDRYSRYLPFVQRIFGILLVLFGIAVFFGWLSRLVLILW